MAKQIYIDENGNEQLVSGTINNAELLPIDALHPNDNTKDYIDSKLSGKAKVTRIYYSGTTTAYGNIDLGSLFEYQTQVIISATVREKNNTNNIHLADIYQNNTNTFGATYGLHIRKLTDNSAVASTLIEGYIWVANFSTT